ncbi:MAG: pyridoxal phosphate-dependent aminotransferase [Bdellovibrio sp.]|nr:MAG: pyridoxal phosphate-dependent aminotransferase [Bdellovibrio sp.]
MRLSQRVQQLKPSPTLAMAAKAKQLRAQGKDVISLSVGEPNWDTFPSIKEAGKKAIDEGKTKYTPAAGIPELREVICQQTKRFLSLEYQPSQVTVSSGGKFILFSAMQSLLDPGDEVLIPAPYWVSYPTMVELAGACPQKIPCSSTSGFKLTAEQLQQAISDKTRLLLLNSPSNPTGKMYSKEELEALAQVLLKHPHLFIISDDIYNRLVFSCEVAPHLLQVCPELQSRTLIVNGVSKTYSMTGWRVGWALGPEEWISAMTRYQSQSVSSACTPSQWAALWALEHAESELKQAREELKSIKTFVCQLFTDLPSIQVIEPDGAFYLWTDISAYLGASYKGQTVTDSRHLCRLLLEEQLIAAVPGIEFGMEGFVRLSFALKRERMEEAHRRLQSFFKSFSS